MNVDINDRAGRRCSETICRGPSPSVCPCCSSGDVSLATASPSAFTSELGEECVPSVSVVYISRAVAMTMEYGRSLELDLQGRSRFKARTSLHNKISVSFLDQPIIVPLALFRGAVSVMSIMQRRGCSCQARREWLKDKLRSQLGPGPVTGPVSQRGVYKSTLSSTTV
jgi:hypothetical protein